MAYRLAIELGETHLRSALADDREVRLLPIADDPGGLAAVVHIAADGTFTVGPDAMGADGGEFVADPLDRLGQDPDAEPLVGALLADMVRRATEVRGEGPELVMIAHPSRWGLGQTTALADAAARAGIDPVLLCSAGAATDAFKRAGGNDAALEAPVGAAILAAVRPDLNQPAIDEVDGPAPIVTLEDIGGAVADPERPVYAYSYSTETPATVFDADPATYEADPEPVAPPPSPPVTQVPLVTPAPVEPESNRNMLGLWVVLGLVVGGIVTLGVLLLTGGDDDNVTTPPVPESTTTTSVNPTSSSTTTTVSTSTTVAETTSTIATTTTVPTSTTATTVVTTTTIAPTTTAAPTTTVAPTTTQTPTTLPVLGTTPDITVSDAASFVITLSGGEDEATVALGDDEGPSVAVFNNVLGEPTDDPGWGPDPLCPDDLSVRWVAYGNLATMYVDRGAEGTILEAWRLKDETPWSVNIRTQNDLGLRSTEAEILDVFPDLESFLWDDSGALGYELPSGPEETPIRVALTGEPGAEIVTYVASADPPCGVG